MPLEIRRKVRVLGGSLALILPRDVARAMELQVDDEMSFVVEGDVLLLRRVKSADLPEAQLAFLRRAAQDKDGLVVTLCRDEDRLAEALVARGLGEIESNVCFKINEDGRALAKTTRERRGVVTP